MSLDAGDAACTHGLSYRLFTTWQAEPGAGLSPPAPTADQTAALKAMCYAFAKAIVAEIQANAVPTGTITVSGTPYSLTGGHVS